MRRTRILLGILGFAVAVGLMVSGASYAKDPVAIVVSKTGSVMVHRAGAGAPVAATVGMRLLPGDRIVPAASASAVLLYRTGRKVTATSEVAIEEPKEAQQAGLFTRSVGTLTRVAMTDANQNPNRQGMIRPIPGTPVIVEPRNGLAVSSARPTLAWFRVADATGYTVQLRRVDAACDAAAGSARPAECRPVRFDAGADTTWQLPESATLAAGATYEWTVAPQGNGRPAPPQRFRVLDADEAARLGAAIEEVKALELDENASIFMRALVYRDAGIHYKAAALLKKLEQSGNASGRAYWQLRGEVLDAIGDLDGAAAAFAAAEKEVE